MKIRRMEPNEHLTRILNQAQDGDPRAEAMMWDLVMHDLRQIASRVASDSDGDARQRANSAGGAPHAAASETTIVNEAFLRVFGQAQVEPWQSRRHFYGTMARAMGSYLIDRSRRKNAVKRGSGEPVQSLHDEQAVMPSAPTIAHDLPVLLVHQELNDITHAQTLAGRGVFDAIDGLERIHPMAAEVVRLRFVCGLSLNQTAELLDASPRTISKHWNFARSWIRRELVNSMDQQTA